MQLVRKTVKPTTNARVLSTLLVTSPYRDAGLNEMKKVHSQKVQNPTQKDGFYPIP